VWNDTSICSYLFIIKSTEISPLTSVTITI
jgi:hypothetical protein